MWASLFGAPTLRNPTSLGACLVALILGNSHMRHRFPQRPSGLLRSLPKATE